MSLDNPNLDETLVHKPASPDSAPTDPTLPNRPPIMTPPPLGRNMDTPVGTVEPTPAEDRELAAQHLKDIAENFINNSPEGNFQMDKLVEFLRSIGIDNLEEVMDFINTNLLTPLAEHLAQHAEFQNVFNTVVTRVFVSVQQLAPPPGNTRAIGMLIDKISDDLAETPNTQTAFNSGVGRLVVDSCMQANNLHNITRTVETINPNNALAIRAIYTLVFTEVINNTTLEQPRLAAFAVDALSSSFLRFKSPNIHRKFIEALLKSPLSEAIIAVLKVKMENPEFKTVIVARLRAIILEDNVDDAEKKITIDLVLSIGGFGLISQLVGIGKKMEGSAEMLKIFVLIEPYIDGVITNGSPEDISGLIEYMSQVSLRIDFVQSEWVDTQIKILGYIDTLKKVDSDPIKLVLNDVLVSSLTSRIIAGIQSTYVESSNTDTQESVSKLILLIIPPRGLDLFSSADRQAVYALFIDRFLKDGNVRFVNRITGFISVGEKSSLEELISGSYEFTNNKEEKTELVNEFSDALSVKIDLEKKKSIVDKYLEEKNTVPNIFLLIILKDVVVLEYYREKLYQERLKELGTENVEKELEDIKIKILDTLDVDAKAERVKTKIEDIKNNYGYKLLLLFESSQASRKQRRREIANDKVEKNDKSNLQDGIEQFTKLLKDPAKLKLLITALQTDPESYAIIAELVEEIYQHLDTMDVNTSTQKRARESLTIILDNREIIAQLPPHIRVIKLEMWKDRLDKFEDVGDKYETSKKEILTKDGQAVNLGSLKGREQKKYESRLAKKFQDLSTPRGECLTEIIDLYNTDRALFMLYSKEPQFANILEYAVDQYSAYPDKFLQISSAEKNFLLFTITNKDIWSQASDRVKFKLCNQILVLWSKQDDSAYDILLTLVEEKDDNVEYSFVNPQVVDFIGAVYQQLPTETRTEISSFAKINEKKNRLRRGFDNLSAFVTRDNTSDYANNLNYLMSYLVTRNRINAKEFYDTVDVVVNSQTAWNEQIAQEKTALDASSKLDSSASNIDSSGTMLTVENQAELDRKINGSFDVMVAFVDSGFKMNPPLTFRMQSEVLDMMPRFIDVIVHAAERSYDQAKIDKIIAFMKKILEKSNPSYLVPPRVYIELLETIDERLGDYSQLTSGAKFAGLNKELDVIRTACEQKSLDATNEIMVGALGKLRMPVKINNGNPVGIDNLKTGGEILDTIKPVIEILFSNLELVQKLLTKQSDLIKDSLVQQLAALALYLNIYTDPRFSKQMEYFITTIGSTLDETRKKKIVSLHSDYEKNIKGLRTRQRTLPTTVRNNLNKLAA